MDERIEKWLYDIKIALSEIDSFIATFPTLDFNLYKNNVFLKRAVERDLEIIGEAVNRILKANPNFIELVPEAKNIVGLRNQIIHAYDGISEENIWAIIINHLPLLKKQIDQLLQ